MLAVPPVPRRWVLVTFLALAALLVFYYSPPSQPINVPFATSFSNSDSTVKDVGSIPARPPAQPAPPAPPPANEAPEPPPAIRPPIPNDKKPLIPPPKVYSTWKDYKQRHPVAEYIPMPSGPARPRPQIQADFDTRESPTEKKIRQERLKEIKEAFQHSWAAYRKYAWGHDELLPLSSSHNDIFGGWAATLVDSLDTLWIMGLHKEFDEAVKVVKGIDFSTSAVQLINVFETTIRYVGGMLSAYDLSGEKALLDKAVELAEMLYFAFDTENRMPNTRWDWAAALRGEDTEPAKNVVSAELGSMTLEFTRLTQLTGDPKFYDAIARITSKFANDQDKTNLPGMWPVFVNPYYDDFSTGNYYSLGAMADSLYEYLPKTWALMGGREDLYRQMYAKALAAAKQALFYKPLNPWKPGKLLASGDRSSDDAQNGSFEPRTQHLTCFVGGMVALGAKLFSSPEDLTVARQLTDGCIWSYNSTATGIAPEIFSHVACDSTNPKDDCAWSENRWHAVLAGAGNPGTVRYTLGKGTSTVYPATPSTSTLTEGADQAERLSIPRGFMEVEDRKYQLRPEALESVFVLYRITGDKTLREHGWTMFDAIQRTTRVEEAFAGVEDVTDPFGSRRDRMESFWTAETLKYAWLLFADEDQVSLDEWVFNTEAHPFKLEKSIAPATAAAAPASAEAPKAAIPGAVQDTSKSLSQSSPSRGDSARVHSPSPVASALLPV